MIPDAERASFDAAEQLKHLLAFVPDDTLIDLIGIGNVFCHLAIASSVSLSAPVAAALSEIADRDVSLVLICNHHAALPDFAMIRILEHHGRDPTILLAMEDRKDLEPMVWSALLAARLAWIASKSSHENLSPETMTIALLWASPPDICRHYIDALARGMKITPSLLFHAFHVAAHDIAIALFAEVARVPVHEIETAIVMRNPGHIRAMARHAGVADVLIDDLLDAIDQHPQRDPVALSRVA